jgi:16S rRNA (cytosine967-C5)-methyltransferase
LAYVTCSPHPAETTAQVDWALKKFDELELVDASEVLHAIASDLQLTEGRKTVQLWPHIHGTDAMFVALFKKKETKRKAKA